MDTIKVTHSDLESNAKLLESTAAQIEQLSTTAKNNVQALISGGWVSAGSVAFGEAMDKWNTGAADIQQALASISRQLSAAAASYAEQDASVAASFRG